jgi:hypothetical protein
MSWLTTDKVEPFWKTQLWQHMMPSSGSKWNMPLVASKPYLSEPFKNTDQSNKEMNSIWRKWGIGTRLRSPKSEDENGTEEFDVQRARLRLVPIDEDEPLRVRIQSIPLEMG